MSLKIGQSVKVKKGILCPDDPEFDLSGWQGRIFEINKGEDGETFVGITWDSRTLKEMPKLFIEKSEADGLDWSSMHLSLSGLSNLVCK